MASFGRSFKPPSYFSLGRRPGMSGRNLSTSSEMSSPPGSPGIDTEAGRRPGRKSPVDEPGSGPGPGPGPGGNEHLGAAELTAATVATSIGEASSFFPSVAKTGSPRLAAVSRPIAIELPTVRNITSAPVYTPPEPLSGRGDLPGGYFPHHETRARIHRPHPFHGDTKKARHHSMSLGVESAPSAPVPDPLRYPLLGAAMTAAPDSRSHPPVTSYMPGGVHDSPMPLGKYHPSNYENGQRQSPQPTPANDIFASIRSDDRRSERLSTPRTDSDAKRRLQQYQRDMTAQATMAVSRVLGKNVNQLSSSGPTTLALGGVLLRPLQLGNPKASKPTSPRLVPLGSPGPVTPMDLADPGSGSSYLDRGRGSSGSGVRARAAEVTVCDAT